MNVISCTNVGKRQHGQNHWFWAVWIGADETSDRRWNQNAPAKSGFCSSKRLARQAACAALKALGHQRAYERGWAMEYLWERRINDNRPAFSRCKVGKNKWLWVVFQSRVGYDDEPLAQGIAESPQAALDDAELICGPVQPASNGMAEMFRTKQVAMKRRASSASTSNTASLEFVYECHSGYSDFDGGRYHSVTPHRVVKKTKGRIYVDINPFRDYAKQSGSW